MRFPDEQARLLFAWRWARVDQLPDRRLCAADRWRRLLTDHPERTLGGGVLGLLAYLLSRLAGGL